jgi:hypothetical protein
MGIRPLFPFPVPDIEPHTHYQAYHKNKERSHIYNTGIEIYTGKLQQQKMYIGPAFIVIAQARTHVPVPLRAKTKAPSIPDA